MDKRLIGLFAVLGAAGAYLFFRSQQSQASTGTPGLTLFESQAPTVDAPPQDAGFSISDIVPEILKEAMTVNVYNISDNGLNLIKSFEGLQLTTYLDTAGNPTIGYGHLIKSGEDFSNGITQDDATQLLLLDAQTAVNAINANVSVPLSQNQFDALTSFVFNVGVSNFRKSTLLKLLNNSDYAGAAQQFAAWNKAGGTVNAGLIARRTDEQQTFTA